MQIKLPHLNTKEWKFLPSHNTSPFKSYVRKQLRVNINSSKHLKPQKAKTKLTLLPDSEQELEMESETVELPSKKRFSSIRAPNEFLNAWKIEYNNIESKIKSKYAKYSTAAYSASQSPKLSSTTSDGNRYIKILEQIKKQGPLKKRIYGLPIVKPIVCKNSPDYGAGFQRLVSDAHKNAMKSNVAIDDHLNHRLNEIISKYKIV